MADERWDLAARLDHARRNGPRGVYHIPSMKPGGKAKGVSGSAQQAVLEALIWWDNESGKLVFRSCRRLAADTGLGERCCRYALVALALQGYLVPRDPPRSEDPRCRSMVHGNLGGQKHATEWRLTYPDKPGTGCQVRPEGGGNGAEETRHRVPPQPGTGCRVQAMNPAPDAAHPVHASGIDPGGAAPPHPSPPEEEAAPVGAAAAGLPPGDSGGLTPAELHAALVAARASVTQDTAEGWQAWAEACGVVEPGEVRVALYACAFAKSAAVTAFVPTSPFHLDDLAPYVAHGRRKVLHHRSRDAAAHARKSA